MKTIFVLFIMLSLLFGCANSPVQTQKSVVVASSERFVSASINPETSWTLCLKIEDYDPECNPIDLRDYARIDANRSGPRAAQKFFGSKDAYKVNYHWEQLALISLEEYIAEEMPLVEIVSRDSKNRTWGLKPR